MPFLIEPKIVPSDLILPDGYLWAEEEDMLVRRARNKDLAVDLGTNQGRSAILLGQSARVVKSYDSRFITSPLLMEHTEKNLAPWANVHLFAWNAETVPPDIEPQSIDVLFADTDHRYRHTLTVLTAWWPYVKIGGVVIAHDYWRRWPGVVQAVDEFLMSRLDVFAQEVCPHAIAFRKLGYDFNEDRFHNDPDHFGVGHHLTAGWFTKEAQGQWRDICRDKKNALIFHAGKGRAAAIAALEAERVTLCYSQPIIHDNTLSYNRLGRSLHAFRNITLCADDWQEFFYTHNDETFDLMFFSELRAIPFVDCFRSYWPILRKGGEIVLHDGLQPGSAAIARNQLIQFEDAPRMEASNGFVRIFKE